LTKNIVSDWGVGPTYNLNVILTHKDSDHTKYIPSIFKRLKKKQPHFVCNILMGGEKKHYAREFRSSLQLYLNPSLPLVDEDRLYYSSNFLDLLQGDQLGFFNSSGCITHLFCPKGNREPNSWSIITRVELNCAQRLFSALIPGDADNTAQVASLKALDPKRCHELRSTIFLYPHHGAQPLFQ
ncbi:hypothetical protein GR268_44370, partial [Rhizobium leguminosarum]|nr:hypothetical protein [Rhizobium leguminosarum]